MSGLPSSTNVHCRPRGLVSAAFAELSENGIVARQDWSCCGTCMWAALEIERDRLLASGHTVRGFAVYDEQATLRAQETGVLWIVAGSFGEALADEKIQREVLDLLARFGLHPNFNEFGQLEVPVGFYFLDDPETV